MALSRLIEYYERETLNELAGFADGYLAKLLSPGEYEGLARRALVRSFKRSA
jgi:hypothetical protein